MTRVCDDPLCQTHKRIPEMEQELQEAKLLLTGLAAEFRQLEEAWRQRGGPGPLHLNGATVTDEYVSDQLSRLAREIRSTEREYLELEGELEGARRWRAAGVDPVPRPEPPEPVPEQLSLFEP